MHMRNWDDLRYVLMVVDQGSVAKIGPRDEVIKSMMKNAEGVTRNIAQAQA